MCTVAPGLTWAGQGMHYGGQPIKGSPDMLDLVLSLSAAVALTLCAAILRQLRSDRPRPPEPRHRPAAVQPISAPPAPAVKPKRPFDPFTSPLSEVEQFLETIGVADWRQPLTAFEQDAGVIDPMADTRELAAVK